MPRRHRPGATATSVVAHIEEIVLATSGEDAFELVFGVATARVVGNTKATAKAIAKVARAHPELAVTMPRDANDELIARVDALLARALEGGDGRLQGLDAIFESLVPRVAKGDKGQFFTPRHVVDFIVRALAPTSSDVVVDPACGSGAFLAHARAAARRVKTFGTDVDPRAVRVARLVAISQGRDPKSIARADGLRGKTLPLASASVIATNPPFAGRADAKGFEVEALVRTPERDVLFLERALDLLSPGGRLGIVLPYNKAAGTAFSALRRWVVGRARIFAVVGLPRETFLPHTSQRTFVLFAKRRAAREQPRADERAMFLISERAGKDSAGDPMGEHDLDEVFATLAPFLAAEGFSSGIDRAPAKPETTPSKFAVRLLADLEPDYVLAPERHVLAARAAKGGDGVPLGDLVMERSERIDPADADAAVLDTSHARDGLLDLPGALRDAAGSKSAKKRAASGDLVISRLRPYLRQIALVHPSAIALAGGRPLALSTEFYVLAPRDGDLAFLLPFLLSADAQAALAAAQEGGHHPRVPRASLFALRVPRSLVRARVRTSLAVNQALADSYRASSRLRALLKD